MTAGKIFGAMMVLAVAAAATPAQSADAFGPVQSATFHWKPGTKIERPTKDCKSNIDWLLVTAPGIASEKSVDVSPKVTQVFDKQAFPASSCTGPDCLPLFVKVTEKDAVGPRTVTIKDASGKKITTTFEVIENAGRCDYPKNGGGGGKEDKDDKGNKGK